MLLDESFADLKVDLEDLVQVPPVDLDGEEVPAGLPERFERLLAHNARVRETWESAAYPSLSEQAFALMALLGACGLSKAEATAVHVGLYGRHGREEDGIRKAPYALRAWVRGREKADAWERGDSGGSKVQGEPDAGPEHEPEQERPAQARGVEQLPPEAPPGDLPPFPAAAYVGLAAEFSAYYSDHLEAPRQFLYLDFLTYFGAMVAAHVRLETQLREEPRLFIVKAGESWLARKSSSQDEVEHFFAPLAQDRLVSCFGAGSAEGLAKRMQAGLPTLLVYDEFRSFVEKARAEGSVLLPMVASLFSRTVYENATKQSEIILKDAHLSLVAACTIDTFKTMFTPQFRSIGLLNRLFVVAGRRGALRPLPDRIPDAIVAGLRQRTLEQIERAEREKPLLRFTAGGREAWEVYYRGLPESPYAARLDTYGLRLLMLFALTTESAQIDRPLVDAAVALLDYEFRVRRELDPVDAEGTVARTEQLILRSLQRGRMTERRLRNHCHTERTGLWAFETATRNLRKQGWIVTKKNGRSMEWWLTPAGREAVGEGAEDGK